MMQGRRRRFLVLTSAAAVTLTLGGCGTHTTAGVPVQAKKVTTEHSPDAAPEKPAPPPKPLPANGIKNLQLSTEDVDELAGLPLDDRTEYASPVTAAGDYDKPECALAMGITKDALGEGEFTAYRGARSAGTKGDNLVGSFTQHVATFETSAKASELFHHAYTALKKCNGTTIKHKSSPTVWKLMTPGAFDGDVVTFGQLQQTDQETNFGWRCDHQARVKNNVIIEAFLCAWANGSPAAAAAVDQISARIPPPDKPAPKAPSDFLGPEKIKSVIVGVPQISKILGANLGATGTFYYPPDPLDFGNKSNCAPLVGLNTNSFGANVDYTAFRETDARESKDSFQHIVNQKAATYVDAGAATAAFRNALTGLEGCGGARVPTPQPDKQWQLAAPAVEGDTARWAVIELTNGQPDTWRCTVDLRAQSNVLLAAKVCQYGNPADVSRQIADEMADSIPK